MLDRNIERPTAFEVKQADTISYSDAGERGYIHLTVAEDQYDPKRDNKELMIADYTFDPVGTGAELKEKPDMWI